jgi:hypothetical protein
MTNEELSKTYEDLVMMGHRLHVVPQIGTDVLEKYTFYFSFCKRNDREAADSY